MNKSFRLLLLPLSLLLLTACQPRSFTFVQMADPQLGFSADGGIDADLASLDRAIDLINRLHPAFVVCTGDMVHDLRNDSVAALFTQHVARLDADIPLYYVPGNHDIHELDSTNFAFYRRHYGEPRFAFRYRGSAFVGYNSTIVQEGESAMEAEQYAWLDSVLSRSSRQQHRFVFCHIPPSSHSMTDAPSYENYPLDMRQKYMALFRDRRVDALYCGHVHYDAEMQYEGVDVVCTNALGRPFSGERGLQVTVVSRDSIHRHYYSLDELSALVSPSLP